MNCPTWLLDGKTIGVHGQRRRRRGAHLIVRRRREETGISRYPQQLQSGRRDALNGARTSTSTSAIPPTEHGLDLLSPDGKTRKAITPGEVVLGTSYLGYNWSPDGKRIVFGATGPPPFPFGDIYVLDLATGAATKLTNTEPDQSKPCCGKSDIFKIEEHPVYSPDGREIAFVAGGEIWMMNA